MNLCYVMLSAVSVGSRSVTSSFFWGVGKKDKFLPKKNSLKNFLNFSLVGVYLAVSILWVYPAFAGSGSSLPVTEKNEPRRTSSLPSNPKPRTQEQQEPQITVRETHSPKRLETQTTRQASGGFNYNNEGFDPACWRHEMGLTNSHTHKKNHVRTNYTPTPPSIEKTYSNPDVQAGRTKEFAYDYSNPRVNTGEKTGRTTNFSTQQRGQGEQLRNSNNLSSARMAPNKKVPVDLVEKDLNPFSLDAPVPTVDLSSVSHNPRNHLKNKIFDLQKAYSHSQFPERRGICYIITDTENKTKDWLKEAYFQKRILEYRLVEKGVYEVSLRNILLK